MPLGFAGMGARAAQLGSRAVPRIAQSSPVQNFFVGAGTGAAGGGLYGFAEGEGGAANRARSAIPSAAIGAGVGGAAPFVAAPLKRIPAFVQRLRARNMIGTDKDAVDALYTVFDADTAQGFGLHRVPESGMPADMGPKSKQLLMETTEKLPVKRGDMAAFRDDFGVMRAGGNQTEVDQRILDRVLASEGRLASTLDEKLGTPKGVEAIGREIKVATDADPVAAMARAGRQSYGKKKAGQTAEDALYDSARATPINYESEAGEALTRLRISDRIPNNVINEANKDLKVRGGTTSAPIREDQEFWSVAQWDAIKRALQGSAKKEIVNPNTGETTPYGASLSTLAGEISSALGDAVPDYRQATQIVANKKQSVDAVRLGTEAVSKPSMTPDALSARIADMPPERLQFVRQGLREGIDQHMGKVKDSLTPEINQFGNVSAKAVDDPEVVSAIKYLNSPGLKDKIRAVLGPDDAQAVFDSVEETISAYELRAATLRRQSNVVRDLMKEIEDPGAVGRVTDRLAAGEPIAAVGETFRKILTNPGGRAHRVSEESAAISDYLSRRLDQTAGSMYSRPKQSLERFMAMSRPREVADATDDLTQRLFRVLGWPVGGVGGQQYNNQNLSP